MSNLSQAELRFIQHKIRSALDIWHYEMVVDLCRKVDGIKILLIIPSAPEYFYLHYSCLEGIDFLIYKLQKKLQRNHKENKNIEITKKRGIDSRHITIKHNVGKDDYHVDCDSEIVVLSEKTIRERFYESERSKKNVENYGNEYDIILSKHLVKTYDELLKIIIEEE